MSSYNSTPATCGDYINVDEVEQQDSNIERADVEIIISLETVTQYEASVAEGIPRFMSSTQEISCIFDLDDFFERPDIAYQHLLVYLPVLQTDQRIHDQIGRYVISQAHEYISRHGPLNMSNLVIRLNVTESRYIPADNEQRDLESSAMRESMVELERRNDGRVAASKEAVKSLLKIVKVKNGGHIMNCPICLEDFKIGSYATSMPCSHLFHRKCIKCWLKESHYCPLCRFEMPTD